MRQRLHDSVLTSRAATCPIDAQAPPPPPTPAPTPTHTLCLLVAA